MMRRFALCAVVMVCVMNTLDASTAADPKKITSIEGITEYRLDNGLKVLLFPDSSKPTVTVNLTIFVGSRHEGYGEAGMAHLLEHMVFKGTPKHPEVPKVLTARGANFNGTTWVDRTNYYETLPANDDNLEFAIQLEADRMVNSYIKAEDLASEMTVVRNEFERGENSPSRVLAERMMSAAFQWHNYGQSTIGNRADIERVPVKNLKRFYKKYYQPDNAMLVVAGKFDPAKALAYAQTHFGKLPRPERELDQTYTEEPAQDGERLVTLRRVGEVAVVGSVFHICSGAHPEYPSVDVLEGILTDSPSGRLYKALVATKKAASVRGIAFSWHDPGAMRLMVEAAEGNDPQVVLGTMLDTIDDVVENGVTEEEVERIRQKFLKYREQSAANSSRLAIELSEWAAMGDWRLYFLYRDRLEKVTVEDVNAAAKKYLKRSNRTVGVFVPTEKPNRTQVPETPALAAMIGDYKGRADIAAGEAFDVSPKNIDERTTVKTINGNLQVALLPKKTRGESVNLRLTLRYGDAENLRGLVKAAEVLPSMMLRGTEKHTRQQIQDILNKNLATLSASGSAGSASFTLQTKRKNLPAIISLLEQVLRHATLPKEELEIIRRARVAGLEKQLVDPQALATTTVRQKISPWPKDDPRYVPTIAEELERIRGLSRDDLLKLYTKYLGGTYGELVIIGDFDADETLDAVKDLLSGWKSEQNYERLATKASNNLGGAEDINTPDKANATYFAAMTLPINDSHEDYPALVLGNFVLGGGSLSSRLGDRVRQKEGLSYGVGSGFNANALDPRAAFYTYAICNPDNMPKVKTAIREEVDKILKDGVTDKELSDAKKGFLQGQEVSRSSDSRLVGTLAENLRAGRDMKYYADLESKIQAATREDVQKALQKHLDLKKLFIVAAGDFEREKGNGE